MKVPIGTYLLIRDLLLQEHRTADGVSPVLGLLHEAERPSIDVSRQGPRSSRKFSERSKLKLMSLLLVKVAGWVS